MPLVDAGAGIETAAAGNERQCTACRRVRQGSTPKAVVEHDFCCRHYSEKPGKVSVSFAVWKPCPHNE